jgi:hypothetical protein
MFPFDAEDTRTAVQRLSDIIDTMAFDDMWPFRLAGATQDQLRAIARQQIHHYNDVLRRLRDDL